MATVWFDFDLDTVEEGDEAAGGDVEEVEVAVEDDDRFPLVGIGVWSDCDCDCDEEEEEDGPGDAGVEPMEVAVNDDGDLLLVCPTMVPVEDVPALSSTEYLSIVIRHQCTGKARREGQTHASPSKTTYVPPGASEATSV